MAFCFHRNNPNESIKLCVINNSNYNNNKDNNNSNNNNHNSNNIKVINLQICGHKMDVQLI